MKLNEKQINKLRKDLDIFKKCGNVILRKQTWDTYEKDRHNGKTNYSLELKYKPYRFVNTYEQLNICNKAKEIAEQYSDNNEFNLTVTRFDIDNIRVNIVFEDKIEYIKRNLIK